MSASLMLWLMMAMAAFVAVNTVLRVYSVTPSTPLLVGALLLFTTGNLLMVRLLRENGLAVAISISSILQLLCIAAVAWAIFGERPTGLQWVGMALGVVAVALIAWPQGGRS